MTTTASEIPTPTSRPRTPRWTETHRRLIDTAAKAFYENGIRSVGVDLLAALAGITKATLYDHFRSKDDLIASTISTLDIQYHDWFVRQVSERSDDPRERIAIAFDVLDEWFHSASFRGCAFINAAVELGDPEHPAFRAAGEHKARTVRYLQHLSEAAGIDSSFAKELMLLMEGAIITALVQGDLDSAKRAGRMAESLLRSRTEG